MDEAHAAQFARACPDSKLIEAAWPRSCSLKYRARQDDREFRLPQRTRGQADQVHHLAPGIYLAEAGDIALLGPPGTGKTHLAIAIGMKAAGQDHRALFATATECMQRLQSAHQIGRLPAEPAQLRGYGLIIIDKVGYIPFNQDTSNSSGPEYLPRGEPSV